MRVSTVSRSRVELTAWPTSPSALSSPTERVKFVGSLIQFFEQPHVLDGDHGLIGKGFEQLDLLLGERADLGATDMNRSNGTSLAQQRRGKHRANAETVEHAAFGKSFWHAAKS